MTTEHPTVEERRKVDLAAATDEGTRLERQRIYMALVDRLWTCDSDANAVLDIVENPEDDELPEYADDEYKRHPAAEYEPVIHPVDWASAVDTSGVRRVGPGHPDDD